MKYNIIVIDSGPRDYVALIPPKNSANKDNLTAHPAQGGRNSRYSQKKPKLLALAN